MHFKSSARAGGRAARVVVASLLALSLAACGGQRGAGTGTTAPDAIPEIILASTTSTQDSGLFDVLIPAFETANPTYKVKVIAVGTGEALKLGETKDADVLLVHAKADEERFVAGGFGKERKDVMYNDFIIVGPEDDPAGAKAAKDATAAMVALATGKAEFVSRGDDSGTHKKELKLWKTSGIPTPTPEANEWYVSTGQGMGETLKIASEKGAYTLADRATYLSMKDTLELVIVREGDKGLLNQYGVIVVSGAKNEAGGQVFFDWILTPEAQKVIGDYGIDKYGQSLFVPNAE